MGPGRTDGHAQTPKGNKHLTLYQGNINKNSLSLSHFKSTVLISIQELKMRIICGNGWNVTRKRWILWYCMDLITWYFTETVIPKDIRPTPSFSFHRIIQLFRLIGTQQVTSKQQQQWICISLYQALPISVIKSCMDRDFITFQANLFAMLSYSAREFPPTALWSSTNSLPEDCHLPILPFPILICMKVL